MTDRQVSIVAAMIVLLAIGALMRPARVDGALIMSMPAPAGPAIAIPQTKHVRPTATSSRIVDALSTKIKGLK